MKLHRRQSAEPDINIAPLIDVVFLLLIFFMVSATFVHESRIRVHLPEAGHGRAVQKAEPVIVTVGADGGYSINGAALARPTERELQRRLGAFNSPDRRVPLLIRADGSAAHRDVVKAMDAASGSGYSRISIATAAGPTSP